MSHRGQNYNNNNKGFHQPNKPKPPPGYTYVKADVLVPVAEAKKNPKVIHQTVTTNHYYNGGGPNTSHIATTVPPHPKPCPPRPTLSRPIHQAFVKPMPTLIKTAPQGYTGGVTWEMVTPASAMRLASRACVAGHEGWDGSPLWVIRARQGSELIPGKLAIKHNAAYVPFAGNEVSVQNIEVLCIPLGQSHWVSSANGGVPPKAIIGGNTATGEPLYIGRAKQGKSLTPGKVHSSHGCCYISFGGKEVAMKSYEVLCKV